ncbi:MAG TPA: hypothetical protein DIT13_04560 [Verrucomicrobiales bacterium]|nr:hypothetical protein [Verrucomicrobiales bacterium]HRJ08442.1 tail fiber domain-containing protein [Prosthecobacter sp.]HRK14815.1 tail fiber domain-containing protein [Prosthecobacter sp.]
MKTHRIHLILAAFCALPGLLAAQTITTGVPGFISYQGKVLNNTGGLVGSPTPVNRTVIFRVWDHPSNTLTGNLIYSEQQTVTIADGEFSVLVGQGVATTGSQFGYSETAKKLADIATAFGGSTRYLGVTVDDGTAAVDNEITPRQQIVSSAFSFRAKFAENLGTSASTALTTVDSGNVGVGNTNPTARFMVTAAGTGTGSPQMIVTADDTTERLRIGVDSTGTGTGYIQSFKEGIGAQNLLLNPSGGNVGIGTTSPSHKLHVFGNTALQGSASSDSVGFSIYNSGGAERATLGMAGAGGAYSSDAVQGDTIVRAFNGKLLLQSGTGSSAICINSSNNVGIGKSNPGSKLDVNGNISATGNLSVTGTNGSFSTPFFPPSGTTTLSLFVAGVGANEPQMRFNRTSDGQFYDIGMNGSNGFVIDDNDTPRLTINSAGNVGIGESNPTARLHVNGAIQVANDNNITGLNALIGFNDLHLQGDSSAVDLSIHADGEVTVGGTRIYNNVTFQVKGIPGDDLVAMFRNPSGADAYYFWNNGAAEKIGGTSWTALSDQRVKKNIVEVEGSLEKLLKLRSVSFEYIDPVKHGEGKYNGFIAQEVEAVYPDWVTKGMDGMKRLTINGFESLAVQAFRELRQEKNAQISKLEEANKELQARLKKLESSNSDSASAGLSNAELLERLALLEARDKAREAKLAAIEKLLLENGQPAAQPVSLKKAANDAE